MSFEINQENWNLKLNLNFSTTGVNQMKFLLDGMLEKNEVSGADVISRTKVIIEGKFIL